MRLSCVSIILKGVLFASRPLVASCVVEEPFRNAGVGRLLMRHFEQSSKAAGDKLVALSTRRALDFYQ